jgi:hypothetical protein
MFFTFKATIYEILLIIAVDLLAIVTFANLIYIFNESDQFIKDIPAAMWYSMSTLTTVGYGDDIPQGFGGRILGSICALCGVILLSVTMPIIVNNFHAIYNSVLAMPVETGKENKMKKKSSRSSLFINDRNIVRSSANIIGVGTEPAQKDSTASYSLPQAKKVQYEQQSPLSTESNDVKNQQNNSAS